MCALRDNLEKEATIAQGPFVTFSVAIEFLKKSFKDNQRLLHKIADSFPSYLTKRKMDQVKCSAVDIIVKQDYFDLPADMTRTEVKAVFDSFIRKDNLYWHNLSITVIYLLAQVKIAKKDMRRLLSQDDDDLGL